MKLSDALWMTVAENEGFLEARVSQRERINRLPPNVTGGTAEVGRTVRAQFDVLPPSPEELRD